MKVYSKNIPQYHRILSKLKKARVDAGFNQSYVAQMLHKPQWYVSRCETGSHRIDLVELMDFAEIYKKSIDYFIK